MNPHHRPTVVRLALVAGVLAAGPQPASAGCEQAGRYWSTPPVAGCDAADMPGKQTRTERRFAAMQRITRATIAPVRTAGSER